MLLNMAAMTRMPTHYRTFRAGGSQLANKRRSTTAMERNALRLLLAERAR
jgi:hypothetical protein